jgi:hypothetical protein
VGRGESVYNAVGAQGQGTAICEYNQTIRRPR